jgi:hypothetical protein
MVNEVFYEKGKDKLQILYNRLVLRGLQVINELAQKGNPLLDKDEMCVLEVFYHYVDRVRREDQVTLDVIFINRLQAADDMLYIQALFQAYLLEGFLIIVIKLDTKIVQN